MTMGAAMGWSRSGSGPAINVSAVQDLILHVGYVLKEMGRDPPSVMVSWNFGTVRVAITVTVALFYSHSVSVPITISVGRSFPWSWPLASPRSFRILVAVIMPSSFVTLTTARRWVG